MTYLEVVLAQFISQCVVLRYDVFIRQHMGGELLALFLCGDRVVDEPWG